MTPPQSTENAVRNEESHTGSVCLDWSRMNTSANKNSFHAVMKLNTDVVTKPGPSSGNVTRRNAPARLQPSIIAASSRSYGIPLTNPYSIQTVNGSVVAKYTNSSDGNVFSKPASR